MSDTSIRIFISGSCAGLAEVRQALAAHPEIDLVGSAVDAESATERLRQDGIDVVMHGSSRGDRLPSQDVVTIQAATRKPLIVVTSGSTPQFLQEALAQGVQDVVMLPQLTDALVFTIRRAHVLANAQIASASQQAAPAARHAVVDGTSVAVFSPKGGVGKSMLATGLAATYARDLGRRTLLIDLDLQFGDAAIMMGVDPQNTLVDLITMGGELDPEKLGGYVNVHQSGVHVIAAPLRPEDAELITEDRIGQLIDVAKQTYEVVVLDTPAHFDATTLAALDRTDRLVLLASLDIPTVKNVKLAMQTLNLLQYPREKVTLVLNRPNARVDLKQGDIERTLDMKVTASIPGDREVAVAVNRGIPVTLSAPRSPAAKAIRDLAAQLIPGVGAQSSSKSAGEGEKPTKISGRRKISPPKLKFKKAA